MPVRVTGLTGITAIAGGGGTAYALKNDGTVWSWGTNQDGELGGPVLLDRPYKIRPVQIPTPPGVTALGDGGQALLANQ